MKKSKFTEEQIAKILQEAGTGDGRDGHFDLQVPRGFGIPPINLCNIARWLIIGAYACNGKF